MAEAPDVSMLVDDVRTAVNAASRAVALVDLETLRFVASSDSGSGPLRISVGDSVEAALAGIDDTVRRDTFERMVEMLRRGDLSAFAARTSVRFDNGRVVDLKIWVRAIDLAASHRYAVAIPLDLPASTTESLQVVADLEAAVGSIDETGRIRQVSADVTPLLGYEPAALIGGVPAELVHASDVDAVRQAVADCGVADTSVSLAVRVRNATGDWQPVSLTVSPAEDRRRGFVFAAAATVPIEFDESPAHSDRVAELERHLVRIGREVEASGLLSPRIRVPDPERVPGLEDLTSRQWQILTRLLQGDRVATIASEMFLSASTVRNHLSAIYKRLGVHSQAELIEKFRATS